MWPVVKSLVWGSNRRLRRRLSPGLATARAAEGRVATLGTTRALLKLHPTVYHTARCPMRRMRVSVGNRRGCLGRLLEPSNKRACILLRRRYTLDIRLIHRESADSTKGTHMPDVVDTLQDRRELGLPMSVDGLGEAVERLTEEAQTLFSDVADGTTTVGPRDLAASLTAMFLHGLVNELTGPSPAERAEAEAELGPMAAMFLPPSLADMIGPLADRQVTSDDCRPYTLGYLLVDVVSYVIEDNIADMFASLADVPVIDADDYRSPFDPDTDSEDLPF